MKAVQRRKSRQISGEEEGTRGRNHAEEREGEGREGQSRNGCVRIESIDIAQILVTLLYASVPTGLPARAVFFESTLSLDSFEFSAFFFFAFSAASPCRPFRRGQRQLTGKKECVKMSASSAAAAAASSSFNEGGGLSAAALAEAASSPLAGVQGQAASRFIRVALQTTFGPVVQVSEDANIVRSVSVRQEGNVCAHL